MPKGPKGEKRPGDVIGAAIKVAKIATGEEEDEGKDEVSSAAAQMGRKGGKARAEKLSTEKRSAIARKAAESRWKKRRQD